MGGSAAALLDRLLSGGCLLWGKPQARIFDGASAGVRVVVGGAVER